MRKTVSKCLPGGVALEGGLGRRGLDVSVWKLKTPDVGSQSDSNGGGSEWQFGGTAGVDQVIVSSAVGFRVDGVTTLVKAGSIQEVRIGVKIRWPLSALLVGGHEPVT